MTDLRSPRVVSNPGLFYAELRERGPVHYHASMAAWMVLPYRDVRAALLDRRLSSGGRRYRKGIDFFSQAERAMEVPGSEELAATLARMMMFHDPVEHTRLRRHVFPAFSRDALAGYRASLREEVQLLLSGIDEGEFDFVERVAYPLPARVIGNMLGIDPSDRAELISMSDDLAYFFASTPPTMSQLVRAQSSTERMVQYFRERCGERVAQPGDDLVSRWMRFSTGPDGASLGADDVAAQCILLLMAGQETTRNLISTTCRTLLTHREALEQLLDDPRLIQNAVEESLRFESPIQLIAREVSAHAEPITMHGVQLKPGDVVFLMLGAANRDPDVFTRPDEFDVTRKNASEHVALGHGLHYCIGAELARLELATVLEVLLPTMSSWRLIDDQQEWTPSLALRGLKRLGISTRRGP